MMIKISLILFACFCSLVVLAQRTSCNLVRDSFYLVTLDIRAKGRYPVIMNGLVPLDQPLKLVRENQATLLSSFYSTAFYTPDISSGSGSMARYCLGDSLGNLYAKTHELERSLLPGRIAGRTRERSVRLQSGETVFIYRVRIGGSFWKTNKQQTGLSTSSEEADLQSLPQVGVCYVPFEIDYVDRPRRF